MVDGTQTMSQPLDSDPYIFPGDLPVPVDDGACAHLEGTRIPRIALRSTKGRKVNVAAASKDRVVFFFYPDTGRPGDPIPRGWNEIPGARGCTPQSCAFRDHYREFKELGFEVYGVSAQSLEEQLEFASRNNLPYGLLNDSGFQLIKALRIPTFEFGSRVFVKRLALVVSKSVIEKVFYPVFPPNKNAETVLYYLRGRNEGRIGR